MPTYSDSHRLIGHEFTIHNYARERDDRHWTHGRCVRVTLAGPKVTHVRLRFPDGSERAYRPYDLRRTVIGYPPVGGHLVEQLEAAQAALARTHEDQDEAMRHTAKLEEQLEALREASEIARGWLYHGLNGGGMKSARKAFDVLDAKFHGR